MEDSVKEIPQEALDVKNVEIVKQEVVPSNVYTKSLLFKINNIIPIWFYDSFYHYSFSFLLILEILIIKSFRCFSGFGRVSKSTHAPIQACTFLNRYEFHEEFNLYKKNINVDGV